MDIEQLRHYCLQKLGTTEGFPFGDDTLVFKIAGKIYVLASLEGALSINLKCDPEWAVELRESYSEIIPGYHMNKKLWNTVSLTGGLSDSFVKKLIDHSYKLVVESLPKKLQTHL